MTEHSKTHTDGSHSGGQPVTNDKSAVLTELREAIREAGVKRNTPRLYTAVMAFDAALHQPTQSDALRLPSNTNTHGVKVITRYAD